MKRFFPLVILAGSLCAAEKKVSLESLPAAVQTTVEEQTKGARLIRISSEQEHGQQMYVVETKVQGKSRDFVVDPRGTVLEVEEEVALNSIPNSAQATLQHRSAGGTVRKVEKVSKGSRVYYEAALQSKSGRTSEISVDADGGLHKND